VLLLTRVSFDYFQVNVWTYMAFGTLYANGLCLIHSEAVHPWDAAFAAVGVATAADHHVHHSLFTYNYGHLFTYFDRLAGTYKPPHAVKKLSAHRAAEAEAAAESKVE
jgi:lathosterol oxidase